MGGVEMTISGEASYALDKTCPGESTLLSFVVPEDIGSSFLEAGWTGQERVVQLVQIARGEAEGVKPGDQLNAIAYLDKIAKDALNTGGLLSEAHHRRILVDGDTKYETDVKVMRMLSTSKEGNTDGNNDADDNPPEDPAEEEDHPEDDPSDEGDNPEGDNPEGDFSPNPPD